MINLGSRIRLLRTKQHLTLVELAIKTGVDQATLSRIENKKMTGTLESHIRIAHALGIRLPDLYNEIDKTAETKGMLKPPKPEKFSRSTTVEAEHLTSGILQKKMIPALLKIKGGGRSEIEEYPSAERFIYVVQGKLIITIGKERKLLKTNESLYFNASHPHHFSNPSTADCLCLSVTTTAFI